MTTPKRMDRKSFLTSTLAACASVTLGACSDESKPAGDTGGTGGAGAGGAGVTGGTSGTGGASTGGTGGASTGGTSGSTSGAGAGGTSGAGTGGMAATSGGGAGGNAMGGAGTAGTSGGGTGGSGGSGGGGTWMCTTETDNGMHSHPLTVPPDHVERGYQDKGVPYVLEDGGTGHSHTLVMEVYEFAFLKADGTVTVQSSMDMGHSHMCVVTCVEE